ncbi:MAG: hypothetical protein L6R37_006724 [Teloschistes peruensis]|nr:MAG: hypothetical protein L6R37_006724 [Teloschistes peruensis]
MELSTLAPHSLVRIGRVFHLTKYGNSIVANGILRAMIAEQAKMMNQPADPVIIDPGQCPIFGAEIDKPPPPAPAPAPYVVTGGNGAQAGKCHVHVSEYEKCGPDKSDLSTEVTIWDVGGNQIGFQSVTEAGATNPLPVKSKLEDPLVVTPEHKGNYVQFALGTENFDSRQHDQTALSWCRLVGKYLYEIARRFAVRANWPTLLKLELGRIAIAYETHKIYRWHSQDLVVEAEHLIAAVQRMITTAEAVLG